MRGITRVKLPIVAQISKLAKYFCSFIFCLNLPDVFDI